MMKTNWNLKLFYKSPKDPQIDKDIHEAEKRYGAFVKKYKDKQDYLKDPAKLARAIKDLIDINTGSHIYRPFAYFHYMVETNNVDAFARARKAQLTEWGTKLSQSLDFFELNIAKIPVATQKKLLAEKKLAPYRYYLKTIFDAAKHNLSEAEEKVFTLMRIPAYSKWIDGTEKLLTQLKIEFRGKEIPFNESVGLMADLPTEERRALHEKNMKKLGEISSIAESELNALATFKKINDELRRLKEPYDGTIIDYENDRKSVMALIKAVTDNAHISHRFHRLKAKLLKLPYLEYADRNASIGKVAKEISFEEAVVTLRKVFGGVDKKYLEIFDGYLENGQIDVFPRVGKRGGAYCSGFINLPTFVLLNYNNKLDDLSTVAHEMGHAFHTELSSTQPTIYQDYSTSTAEVASTFFEAIAADHVFETLSDDEKISALHAKITDDISTIFRQIALFNFETDLHKSVRSKGELSHPQLAELLNKHMAQYLGPAVKLKPLDGNNYIYWWHIRSFFYVYSYAFGQLISKALYAQYKEDKSFIKKIEKFLSAGGSDSPENIFKSIGIDVTKPDFWVKGLKSIERDIETLEKLTKKR